MNLFTSYYDSGMIASCIGNAYLAKAFPPLGGLGAVHSSGRKKRAILPNEPILFSRTFRWSNLIFRNLCRLQRHLQMGSFSETNPFRGGVNDDEFLVQNQSPHGDRAPWLQRGEKAGRTSGRYDGRRSGHDGAWPSRIMGTLWTGS